MKRILLNIIMATLAIVANANTAGTWNLYPAYNTVQEVQETSTDVYVLASGNLFSYHKSDNSLTEYMKEGAESAIGHSVDCLTSMDITHIAWVPQAKKLVIVYSDYMIDLMDADGNVGHIMALKNSTDNFNKNIDSIYVSGKYAFLKTASTTQNTVSIIKIDASNEYIVKTYKVKEAVPDLPARSVTPASGVTPKYSYAKPDGPNSNYWWRLTIANGKLYCADGEYDIETQGHNTHEGNVKIFDGKAWTALSQKVTLTKSYKCASQIVVDPRDASHVFELSYRGLLEFKDTNFVKAYTCGDFSDASVSNGNILLSGAYDSSSNLWFVGHNSPYVSVLNASGTFSKYNHSDLLDGDYNDAIEGTLVDSRGLVWFCSTRYGNGRVFCYNPKTDVLKRYDNFVNQDGTPYSPYMRTLTEDTNGNIWISTNVGPFYISASNISSGVQTITQPKINRDDGTGLADYLLSGIDIHSIGIDKSNRKWIATSGSGVYLISSDCKTEFYHFTKDNSPLPSNVVYDVKIDNTTGIVYFATEDGLCSYQSDITPTYGDMSSDNVYAYPNPVTPDYTGDITIMGISTGSTVKITTATGYVVNSGVCNGVSYVWDGCDANGSRVASGVYMVLVADASGEEGCVAKIAVIK